MSLAFDVVPGKSLGPFVLGMPVGQAIAYLREHERVIATVELTLQDAERQCTLALVDEKIALVFGPDQTLQRVKVEMGERFVSLSYEGVFFAGPRAASKATLEELARVFGPTYPGERLAERFLLDYPGLGFEVPLAAPLQEEEAMPLHFEAQRLVVFHGRRQRAPEAVSLSKVTAALPGCERYLEPIELVPGQGIRLRNEVLLAVGAHEQSVRSELGVPSGEHIKTDGRMKIHGAEAAKDHDYFLRFAGLGLDVLMSGREHVVLKFIAHSNHVQHLVFGEYARCNWTCRGVQVGARLSPETRQALVLDVDSEPLVDSRPGLTTRFHGGANLVVEVLPSNLIETVQIW